MKTDETYYRLGYEAALHAEYRCKEYDQILAEMQADLNDVQQRYPGADVEEAFIKGFEDGRAKSQAGCQQSASTQGQTSLAKQSEGT